MDLPMSSNPESEKSHAPAIEISGLSKCYQLYQNPRDRLKQFFWRNRRQYFRELWALRDIHFSIMPGEVVGIVGRNGSGKSTLLQLVCGTLTPTHGELKVRGRIAALLELGAGFNPEFTGRENIKMNAAILGLSQDEIDGQIEHIIEFSGIRDFIDQPVKIYSSGMYVRLAFSVAINVDPDILVIDEALSVGDGAFSHKSFNRIMQLRDAGKTILFCSHSLYQVETLCDRTIWINEGKIMQDGSSAEVVAAYQGFLDKNELVDNESTTNTKDTEDKTDTDAPAMPQPPKPQGSAHLKKISVMVDGVNHKEAVVMSNKSNITIQVNFMSDSTLPCPTVAITLHAMDGRVISSAANWEDDFTIQRNPNGLGEAIITFDQPPLLKGDYFFSVLLLCDRGLHLFDAVRDAAKITVQQEGRLQGYFVLEHHWHNPDLEK